MELDQRAQDKTTEQFVHEWFDLLTKHEPVEQLLPYISNSKLEMIFPECTIRSHADFLDWYAAVGAHFTDQEHTIEELWSQSNGDVIDVTLTLIWTETQKSDDVRSIFRINQDWSLAIRKDRPWRIIQKYRVVNSERVYTR